MKQIFILFLLLLVASPVLAVELSEIEVQNSSIFESEVLSPVPIKIITQEEIKKSGATRLQEALYLKEGVSFVRSGTKLAPSIRGFNPEHTLFLINGQRLANEPSNKYDLERLDLSNIERIEIIKGPLSTMYGADALGGVINLITKKIDKDKVTVNLRNATYDFKSPRNSVALQADKKLGNFGISLFGTHVKEDPLYFNKKVTIDDGKEMNSVGTALEYKKGNFGFRGRQSWSEDSHDSLYYNFLNANYVRDEDHHRRTFSSGEFSYQQDRVKHSVILTHTSYKKEGDTYMQSSDALLMNKRARIYVTEMNYRNEIKVEDHRVMTGVGHRREDFFGNAFNYQDHSKYLPNYYSFYVIDQWAASDRLVIIPSLRYEKLNYFEDKLLSQLGTTLSLDESMENNLKFNFAQGYRVPTPKDLYVDLMIMKGNYDLVPETTNTYNLEYHLLRADINLKLGLFYNDVDNMIQEYYNPSLGKYTFRNLDNTKISGTEFFLRKRFSKHENSLQHTFLEAMDSSGERLANRARHHTIFNTTFFFDRYLLSNDISCRNDELLYDEDNKLKEFHYCSLDLGLTYQHEKYRVLLKVFNIINHYEQALPQRPRLVTLALNSEF